MAAYSEASSHHPSSTSESENSLLGGNILVGARNGEYDKAHAKLNGYVSCGESVRNVRASKADFGRGSNGGDFRGRSVKGVLDIFIHHAFGIHNICIYENQDVYAKVFFAHNPMQALCTRVVIKGGKNPVFNESLQIGVENVDSVLKCEIWMSSQARHYLEDQLLGFVLIPLSGLVGEGKHTQDYDLSSTELFHSHAGTLRLSFLYYDQGGLPQPFDKAVVRRSETLYSQPERTDTAALSCEDSEIEKLSASNYGDIVFQDIQAVAEDEQLVCKFLNAGSTREGCRDGTLTVENVMTIGPPFLQMGSLSVDPNQNTAGEEQCEVFSSLLDESQLFSYAGDPVPDVKHTFAVNSDIPPASSCSQRASRISKGQGILPRPSAPSASTQTESPYGESGRISKEGDALGENMVGPLVNVYVESEPKVVQQQIVDMYMKSMEQFTEALAKMQLPMDIDSKEGAVPVDGSAEHDSGESRKKNSQKVFYGSSVFF